MASKRTIGAKAPKHILGPRCTDDRDHLVMTGKIFISYRRLDSAATSDGGFNGAFDLPRPTGRLSGVAVT